MWSDVEYETVFRLRKFGAVLRPATARPATERGNQSFMASRVAPEGGVRACRSSRLLLLLLLLLFAWYLTPVALQGTNCTRDMILCHDHGDKGDLRHGRDHIVCVYADRVIKTVRSCSPNSGRQQIIDDHLHYWNAEWNAKHTVAAYGHLAILLVPFAHEGKRWSYRNARNVTWSKLNGGLAALDSTAQKDGMIVTDLSKDNLLVGENGTGIVIDFDLHRAWGRTLFAQMLTWLGCAGCSQTQEGQRNQPHWCTRINFCSQVRISPFLNLYSNADTVRAIHAAMRSNRRVHGSGQARQALTPRGGKVSKAAPGQGSANQSRIVKGKARVRAG